MQPTLRRRIKELVNDVFGNKPAVEKIKVDNQVASIVLQMVDSLPAREKACVCLRYGLTERPKALGEIAVAVGKVENPNSPITKARAEQMLRRGLRMMRHPVRSERIRALMDALSS